MAAVESGMEKADKVGTARQLASCYTILVFRATVEYLRHVEIMVRPQALG